MNKAEYTEFLSQLKELNIPTDIGEWLNQKMQRWARIRKPLIESENNLDPDDWYDLVVEGTIELCRFRPIPDEVDAVCRKHLDATGRKFEKFVDFAIVIAALKEDGPDTNAEIFAICPSGFDDATRDLWERLCKLAPDSYNDQFMIKCYLDNSILEQIDLGNGFINRVRKFFGRNFFWLNSAGVEGFLKRNGYKFLSVSTLNDYPAKTGDVIKIVKKGSHDQFKLFALVSKVTNNKIDQVQFKTSFNSPLSSTVRGMDLFFFRDSKTLIEGIWTK